MKKKIFLIWLTCVAIVVSTMIIRDYRKSPKKEIAKEEVKTKKEKIFYEEIGCCKFENKDRHFMYFTNEKDINKLIEFGRKQKWAPAKFTYVTFFTTKDENIVKPNTLYTDDREKGFLLKGLVSDESVVIGTYKKAASGLEFWLDGANVMTGGTQVQIK